MHIGSIGGAMPGLTAAHGGAGVKKQQSDPFSGQIQMLQQRIEELKKSETMDPKQKQMLIEQYNQQINELKAQQQVKSLEKVVDGAEPQKSKDKPVQEDAGHTGRDNLLSVSADAQKAMFQADSSKEISRALSGVRQQKVGEMRWALTSNFIKKPDYASAAAAAAGLSAINRMDISQARKAAETAKTESGPSAAGGSPKAEETREAEGEETALSGTGRMEAGQFLNEEA